MGLPTHRDTRAAAILRRRWAKAHKNWTGGFPTKTEAQALAQDDAGYLVGGNALHADLGADGTVDRAIDAAAADRIARSQGGTDGDTPSDGDSAGSKGV